MEFFALSHRYDWLQKTTTKRPINTGRENILELHSKKSDLIKTLLVEVLPLFQNFSEEIIENKRRRLDIEERGVNNNKILAEIFNDVTSKVLQKTKYSKKPLNEKKKKTLELCWEMRCDGKTYENISDYLNKEKIPTFSGRGKWHAQTVHRFLVDSPDLWINA